MYKRSHNQSKARHLVYTIVLPAAVAFHANSASAESSLSASEAQEQLGTLITSVKELRGELDEVAKGYGVQLTGLEEASVERRLREGKVHFLLNDFLRASIVLMNVVENEENRSHPQYDDCVYYLAESLRRTGNFSGARSFFEDLLSRARGQRLKEVVVALLGIADSTGRYDGVEVYVDRLMRVGDASDPQVNYHYGKTLFRSAGTDDIRYSKALEVFSRIAAGGEASAKASYYAGVTLLQMRKIDEAILKFQEAAQRAGSAVEADEIKDLAQLALGRAYYEKGDVTNAVDSYQEINEKSPHFSDMLFEVAWAYVKASNQNVGNPEEKARFLDMALRMSELLMASAPDHKLFPEARILEGNLQIRLGAPETAYDTFQTIIDRYGGAQTKLRELRQTLNNPTEFLQQLVDDRSRTSAAAGMLPPVAIDWAIQSETVRDAVDVMKELSEGQAFLRESRNLIKTMEESLRGEQKYTMFTGLGDARARAYAVENQLLKAHRRMLQLERGIHLPYLTEKQNAQLNLFRARRMSLEKEVRNLPGSTKQVGKTSNEINAKYDATKKRVFRQNADLSAMRSQVAAVEVWLSENRSKLTDREIALMSKRARDIRSVLIQLENEAEELGERVETAQTISSGDGGRVHAARLREAYAANIERESGFLKSIRGKLPVEFQSSLTAIDAVRGDLRDIAQELQTLQRALDRQILSKVDGIRERLKLETEKLDRFEQEQDNLSGKTRSLLGPVALASLQSVIDQFNDLVMKADVGIIDVAWARKRDTTAKVNSAVDQEQQRVQDLTVKYQDFIEED
ncbi:MAG: tetratricopeptide repeat protein [Myxococcota bacterium]|nr:tetratricopeptide repeat protein [Myxococcota bacterium]